MKEILDVLVIVPLERQHLRFVVDKRHFRSEEDAMRYRVRGGTSYVREHVIRKATLTMEEE